jgi:hypothetical protein
MNSDHLEEPIMSVYNTEEITDGNISDTKRFYRMRLGGNIRHVPTNYCINPLVY